MTATQLRRFLLSNQVRAVTHFSDMHLNRMEKAGKFPRRFKIATDTPNGRVGWWEDEVQKWLEERGQKPQQQTPPPDQPQQRALPDARS